MARLHALTCTCVARQSLSRPQTDHLLLRARECNAEEAVTGVLLHPNGKCKPCMERLEPGQAQVREIFEVAPRHRHIASQPLEPIAIREFGPWSMADRAGGRRGMSQPMHLGALRSGPMRNGRTSTARSDNGRPAICNAHRGSGAL